MLQSLFCRLGFHRWSRWYRLRSRRVPFTRDIRFCGRACCTGFESRKVQP